MAEVFECPICFNPYSELCKPMNIPCGHTLCMLCLQRLQKKNTITCPLCNKHFIADFAKFNINYAVLQVNTAKTTDLGTKKIDLLSSSTKLQKDIQILEDFQKKITNFNEESLRSSNKCKQELDFSIKSIISSLVAINTQYAKKIDNFHLKGGESPLLLAIRYKHAAIAELLIRSNADINAVDNVSKSTILI